MASSAKRPVHIVGYGSGLHKLRCFSCKRHLPQSEFQLIGDLPRRKAMVLHPRCRKCREFERTQWTSSPLITPAAYRFFTQMVSRTRSGAAKRRIGCIITVDDIVGLYVRQGGICALTGEKMIPRSGKGRVGRNSVSIDRIDSSDGYHMGNVQLVRTIANLAKNNLTVIEFVTLCKQVLVHTLREPEQQ